MRTLYIECKMGAAGDMLMAALYELLDDAQKQQFLEQMNTIFGQDICLHAEQKISSGITGTHMHVQVLGKEEAADPGSAGISHTHDMSHIHEHEHEESHAHDHAHEHTHDMSHIHEHNHEEYHAHDHAHTHAHSHSHYSYTSISEQIRQLPLDEHVRAHAAEIYRLIGEAEAHVHSTELEQIHFHEVGSLDALADVTGCCLLLSMLEPARIVVSPIHVGNGTVHCAHGILPVPAPATAELLKGIPYYTGEINTELCTPTGAAILKHYADSFCPMPAMCVSKIGVGLGTKEFPVLNAVRAFLGDTDGSDTGICTDHPNVLGRQGSAAGSDNADQIADISCNLDDMTGEALGYCMELLLTAGALDVFFVPIQMKKNRPGILLHCFCPPTELDRFCQLILRHTTTRGVRYQFFDRKTLSSRFEDTKTPYGTVRRKISEGGLITKAKYEFEDLKNIADKEGMSLQELLEKLSL